MKTTAAPLKINKKKKELIRTAFKEVPDLGVPH